MKRIDPKKMVTMRLEKINKINMMVSVVSPPIFPSRSFKKPTLALNPLPTNTADNITDAISRIPNILEDTTPHVVLINSMSRDMPHATHAQYLESVNLLLGILDRWQSDPTEGLSPRQVMWAHTMAVHEGLRPRAFVNSYHIRQLSVQVESIATQHRIPTIDLFSATFGRPDRSWDGMHVRAPQSRRPSRSARATTATTVTREQFCAGDWYGREFDPQAYPPTMTRTVAQIAYNTIFNVWAERVGY
eukprot:comp11564_c0_seq2/m.6036 comp11564_c0_seq2/g.6036  ORF comp11564_c0_seq2/g.6036 comp11564_c0_seq2/m.6036 type:complete len:246 (-) comp11564_c0_seq2:724-1461(-)